MNQLHAIYLLHKLLKLSQDKKDTMAEKLFLDAEELLLDSFRLGAKIVQDNFKPTYIIAIWRGGTPIGVAVQEMLHYHSCQSDHIAIRTSSYSGIDNQDSKINIHGLNYLIKKITAEDKLLIVDDVFDTGLTIASVIDHLKVRARLNTPTDIRVAVPYFKPDRNQSKITPDYFIHTTKNWLKYPHSLEGLTETEIKEHRPELYTILNT